MSLTNREILTQFLEAIRGDIITEHLAQGQRASGRTLESLEVSVNDNGGSLSGSGHIGVLETGRKPGLIPKDFKGIILKWMADKGIFQGGDDKAKGAIAYFIARKISEEGTKLFRAGGQSGVLSKAITTERVDALVDSLARKYMTEISSDIIEEYK